MKSMIPEFAAEHSLFKIDSSNIKFGMDTSNSGFQIEPAQIDDEFGDCMLKCMVSTPPSLRHRCHIMCKVIVDG